MSRRGAATVLLVPLACVAVGVLAAPAAADPAPVPAPCPSLPTIPGVPGSGCPLPTTGPGTVVAPPLPAAPATRPAAPGILGPFTVDDRNGIGIDHYDVFADDGGTFNFSGKVLLLVANAFFYVGRVWTGFTAWLTDWALRFGLVDAVTGPARDLADSYQTDLIGPLGLRHLFLTLAGAWSALLVFRGRVRHGIAEAAVSLLISAAAVTALANPVGLLLGPHGLMAQTRDTSVAVASIGLTHGEQSEPDPAAVSRPVTDALVDTLIRKPHEILNFGTVLDDPHHPDPCLPVYDQIVAAGPWYGGSTVHGMGDPWTLMGHCNPTYGNYNRDPTMDRAFGALFAMIASIVINLLVDLVDIGLAVTPVVLAFDAVLLVAAIVLAILPGPGRALLYRRIGAVAGALASVLAATLFLTVFLTTIQAFLVADLGVHLAVRFLVVDIAAIAGWRWRRSLTTAARQFGGNIGHRMETARTGGAGHGWIRPATAATLGGLELAHLATHTHRSIRRHAYRAQLAAYRARRHIHRNTHRHGVHVGQTGARSRSGNKLLAVLGATGPGRLLHRTAALGTTLGLTTLKYTAGAPVYLPRATRRARERAAARREQLRNRLAQARAFTTEYTGNLTSVYHAATKATRPARTAARAGATATAPTATATLRPTPPASAPRAGTGERDAPSHDEPGERLRRRLNRRRSARPD